MHQDHEPLNGSTATIIYKLARLEVMAETTDRRVCRIERRLDSQQKPPTQERLLDLSGWLTGAVILILALAGKWNELGAFLAGNVK